MPLPTPFHPRTSALCTSLFWKDWAGYHAVRSYDTCHEREYFAIRHSAALIDVTPLFKYEVRGADAGRFLSWVLVRDAARMKVGRVGYVCWCDDDGKVVDDGTVTRLDDTWFRLTAAEPSLGWLQRHAGRFRVEIEDVSRSLGALSLQGPRSRDVLQRVVETDLTRLRYFRAVATRVHGRPVHVTRTGYTGDLGFEIWVPAEDALAVWDGLIEAGRDHRIEPTGLDAMDVSRVEAGYIMNGVDYFSAHHCLIESRKSTPDELGLGWTVRLDRDPFLGQAAIRAERRRGRRWALVGLELDWDEFESRFEEVGLPAQVPAAAWRDPRPVYDGRGNQVGQATSGAWSPTLKANLALATVEAEHADPGTVLRPEVTVEYRRETVAATVRELPFLDLPRKRRP